MTHLSQSTWKRSFFLLLMIISQLKFCLQKNNVINFYAIVLRIIMKLKLAYSDCCLTSNQFAWLCVVLHSNHSTLFTTTGWMPSVFSPYCVWSMWVFSERQVELFWHLTGEWCSGDVARGGGLGFICVCVCVCVCVCAWVIQLTVTMQPHLAQQPIITINHGSQISMEFTTRCVSLKCSHIHAQTHWQHNQDMHLTINRHLLMTPGHSAQSGIKTKSDMYPCTKERLAGFNSCI